MGLRKLKARPKIGSAEDTLEALLGACTTVACAAPRTAAEGGPLRCSSLGFRVSGLGVGLGFKSGASDSNATKRVLLHVLADLSWDLTCVHNMHSEGLHKNTNISDSGSLFMLCPIRTCGCLCHKSVTMSSKNIRMVFNPQRKRLPPKSSAAYIEVPR